MMSGVDSEKMLQDTRSVQERVATCRERVASALAQTSLEHALTSLSSETLWCDVWQWTLWQRLQCTCDDTVPLTTRQLHGIDFLLANTDALVALLASGGCLDWSAAVSLLGDILVSDSTCASAHWKVQLALGIALCFADGQTEPTMHIESIEPLQRYNRFCSAVESGQLLHNASDLTAWHWRYVVGSWHADSCLGWAQQNVSTNLRCLEKIGEAARMVRYTTENHAGVSVHDGLRFYDDQKATMSVIHEYGGVCGAVSKFGASACQAFGVPAMPVAQPGHCALIWRTVGGKWALENDAGGWGQSTMHDAIQRTWQELACDDAGLITVMEEAQRLGREYHKSECLRLVAAIAEPHAFALLVEAVVLCRYNLPAWADLLSVVSECKLKAQSADRDGGISKESMCDVLSEKLASVGSVKYDLARFRPVHASDDCDRACNLVDGSGSEWFPTSTDTQWIEADLQCAGRVEEVHIQWWGDYGAKTGLSLFSRKSDEDFSLRGVRESDASFNGWTSFGGWDEPTRFIRLELTGPSPDCFGLGKQYGLRQLQVLGCAAELHEKSSSPPDLVTLVMCWAELIFSSSETADVQVVRFLRGRIDALAEEEALARCMLKPLRPTSWRRGKDANLWLTVGAPALQRAHGKHYYELELGSGMGDPQIGWVTDGFETRPSCSGEGVGDDEYGWAVDGVRHCKWHSEQYESKWPTSWSEGDVIGCAIDIDAGKMTFSHNGVWVPAASFDFEACGRFFYPAASMRGHFCFIFAEIGLRYGPPPQEEYQPLLHSEELAASMPASSEERPPAIDATDIPGVFARPR